jgi:hypothetical protein
MTSLRRVLLENVGLTSAPADSLGGDDEQGGRMSAAPAIDRDKLKHDLSAVNKANNRYFLVCVAMVVLLFLVSVGVILTNLNRPEIIKVVMSAFGISSAGLITVMIKLWREKSNIELLLLLAINMDTDTLKTVVTMLVNRL